MNWDFKAYGAVELIQARGGRLCLQKADEKSDKEYVFGHDQLKALFETIKNSGMEMHADHVVIFGDKLNDNGRPIAIPAAKLKENSAYGLAYEPWQFAKLETSNFRMLVSFRKPKLGIYTTDYKPSSGNAKPQRAALTIKRAGGEAPKADKPQTRGPRQQ